jgi:molybdopterin-guanine dinucleotide biosynthesis protein A
LPKGLQHVGGERIIDRVARALRAATDRVLVISNDPAASSWLPGAEIAGDVLPGRASLIGVHSALVHARGDAIVVAWDMPFVSPALLTELRARLRPGVSAVIPNGVGGPEAACAAYAASALPHIEELVRNESLKLSELLHLLPNAQDMSVDDVRGFGDPETMFMNVNSPDDLTRAQEIVREL